jgi:hypothetical protein
MTGFGKRIQRRHTQGCPFLVIGCKSRKKRNAGCRAGSADGNNYVTAVSIAGIAVFIIIDQVFRRIVGGANLPQGTEGRTHKAPFFVIQYILKGRRGRTRFYFPEVINRRKHRFAILDIPFIYCTHSPIFKTAFFPVTKKSKSPAKYLLIAGILHKGDNFTVKVIGVLGFKGLNQSGDFRFGTVLDRVETDGFARISLSK